MTAVPILAIDPFDRNFLADPYARHDELRDAGPVIWLESIGAFGMARFAEVQAALRDHETYCSGRGVGLSDFAHEEPWRPPSLLLEADPPLHDRTRGIMNKIVTLTVLRDLLPAWREKAEALVERLVEQRRFDAVAELGETFPMLVFPDAVGVPMEGRENLLPYARAVFNAFGPRNDIFDQGNLDAAESIEWIANACQRESLAPGTWGAAIYAASDRGECTEAEAGRLVRSFLSAGVDTTVNGIAHLMLAFATFPDQWRQMRDNPHFIRTAFDESLRWDSTVQTFFRTTSRETEMSGVTIPSGSKVLLFLAAANRDPRKWTRPESFEVGRSSSGHVGFGFGIHQCLGQMVARQEAMVVLDALRKRVSSIRLTGTPTRRLNNTLHAITALPVEVDPL